MGSRLTITHAGFTPARQLNSANLLRKNLVVQLRGVGITATGGSPESGVSHVCELARRTNRGDPMYKIPP